ncbi:MAG: hypothetical protein MUE53_01255 [Chitinophagales bacterium]|jgi:hypothetical protein|nr:hypothetical protein [Chitinophagales bacterium]
MFLKEFIRTNPKLIAETPIDSDYSANKAPLIAIENGYFRYIYDFLLEIPMSAAALRMDATHFEALERMTQHDLPWYPIVDEEGLYLGIVYREELSSAWISQQLNQKSDILILASRDITPKLANLCQILEAEHIHILHIEVVNQEDKTLIYLRVHHLSEKNFDQSLEKHGFEVMYSSVKSQTQEIIETRFQELVHFLNL